MPAFTVPLPTQRQIVHAYLDVIVAEAIAPDSLLQSTLAPYGIALDATTPSPTDPEELRNVKVGVRGSLPRELTILLSPTKKKTNWYDTPGGRRSDYALTLYCIWVDPPDGNGVKLTNRPGVIYDCFMDFCEALEVVVGPESLAAQFGGWEVPGGGILIDPKVTTLDSCAWAYAPMDNHRELIHYGSLLITGEKYSVIG